MNQAYFVIIAVFLSIFGSVYTYLTYRNKERMALINSGFSPDSFRSLSYIKSLLLFGLVLIGFAFGITGGFFLEKHLLLHYNPNQYRNYPQAYLIMVPLCLGIALVVAFLINRRSK